MKFEYKTFPFVERDDYSLPSWLNDLLNLIKKKGFLAKKEDSFLVFMENSVEFIQDYCDGMSPLESYNQFVDYIKE